VSDVMPKTFNGTNTCVSGASWNSFQRRYPEKLSKNFGSFVVVINHCIAILCNDSSKIAVVDLKAHEAPLVKEELPAEEDANHCFVYDLSKSRRGRYLDGSYIELPFS
jgi:hypothetical protein